MPWEIITAIATVLSMLAYVVTALYIRAELKSLEKDRFVNITSELYAVWQGREFMEAQFWLLHTLQEQTWTDFIREHRGDVGEMAFHQVGSFYDRVGTLVRLKLISDKEILSTIGAFAIAVWQKIEPLVMEARRIENSVLFDDYEQLLPACHECYVPSLGRSGRIIPLSLTQSVPRQKPQTEPIKTITVQELKRRLDANEPVTILDVRQRGHVDEDPRRIPGSIMIPPDQVDDRLAEIPKDHEVVALCA